MRIFFFNIIIICFYTEVIVPTTLTEDIFINHNILQNCKSMLLSEGRLNGFSMGTRINRLISTPVSLSFKGNIVKSFEPEKPCIEYHDFIFTIPFQSWILGFKTGIYINCNKYKSIFENADNSMIFGRPEQHYYKKISTQLNHTQLDYILSGFLDFQMENANLTIHLKNKFIQNWGYYHRSTTTRNIVGKEYRTENYITDYDPDKLSHSLSGSVVYSLPMRKLSSSNIIYIGCRGIYTKEKVPINKNAFRNEPYKGDIDWDIVYMGYRMERKVVSFFCGLKQIIPVVTSKRQIFLPLKFFYGIDLDDVFFSYNYSIFNLTDEEYFYEPYKISGEVRSFKIRKVDNILLINFIPTVYFTKRISLSIHNLATYKIERLIYLDFALLSGVLNYTHPLSENLYLVASLNSGEFNYSFERNSNINKPFIYRKKSVGLSLQLFYF